MKLITVHFLPASLWFSWFDCWLLARIVGKYTGLNPSLPSTIIITIDRELNEFTLLYLLVLRISHQFIDASRERIPFKRIQA